MNRYLTCAIALAVVCAFPAASSANAFETCRVSPAEAEFPFIERAGDRELRLAASVDTNLYGCDNPESPFEGADARFDVSATFRLQTDGSVRGLAAVRFFDGSQGDEREAFRGTLDGVVLNGSDDGEGLFEAVFTIKVRARNGDRLTLAMRARADHDHEMRYLNSIVAIYDPQCGCDGQTYGNTYHYRSDWSVVGWMSF